LSAVVVAGSRVSLVRPDPAWFALAASWINDPAVARTLITSVPWPLDPVDVASWLPSTEPPTAFLVVPAGERRPVGLSHFHSYDAAAKSIKLAILLEPTAQGRGFGTEAVRLMVGYAFSRFDLNRVALSAFANNPAGLRAYERAGFRVEGVRRRAWFREGRFRDDVLMAVLRRDWERGTGDAPP
jgi:RimJ/RimL family protein N-acetyltransferase